MYPVSAAFMASVGRSHVAVSRVTVLTSDGPVDIPISGGSVDIDDSREIRTTCTVNVADPTLVPRKKGDLLHPDTGNEFEILRGVRFPDGTEELAPLGVFTITKPTISDSSNSFAFQVQGSDRGIRVQRARWTTPYAIAGGSNIATAAAAALNNRVPGLPTPAFSPTQATTPAVTFGMDTTNDPWKDIQSLFSSNGQELFFDATGRPVSRPIPDTTNQPLVASFIEGINAILSVQRDIDPTQRYTAVVVRGEGTGVPVPVYAVAQDPTATDFVPYFLTSNLITTQAQADAAAAALLLKVGRSYEDIQISIVPNPALTAGDVLQVQRNVAGVSGLYVASHLVIPLSPTDQMSITMKPQR